jgi:two-component system, LytTR family, sensor kinase
MMVADNSRNKPHAVNFLLSWDRLGFRLLIFGGMALLWAVQSVVWNNPWQSATRSELAGLLPWAFLAPLVLSLNQRIRRDRMGLPAFLVLHFLGMILVFIPYWLMQHGVFLAWECLALGLSKARLATMIPTKQNVFGTFVNVPFVYFIILLGAEAMKHAQARREEERQAERLAGQLSEARLALLQRQLHPHFLFNALQAISTLMHRDPKSADRILVRLSSLLRAMLEDAGGQKLSLRTELELARQYLDIELVRFEDRLTVEWKVDESLLDVQVPSLILLPLVENAIRHGLSPKMGPGHLSITARPEGASLILLVEDDGLGAVTPLRCGVGIGNTRERLNAFYGEEARIEIETPPKGGFHVKIRLPLQTGKP